MVKKKSNKQNIIIIILSILLLISIGFGITYSYYNGKTNLVTGEIITANLSISLTGVDQSTGQTTDFVIKAPVNESFLVPGNNLLNVQLNLINKCNRPTYIVVVYTLSAVKLDETKLDVTDQLSNMPALDFQEGATDSRWEKISYKCQNNTSYTCLVGINPFETRQSPDGDPITVLQPNSLKIPTEWDDRLQNCEVSISVTAYAIQAENLEDGYRIPISLADDKIVNSTGTALLQARQEKAQAVAKAVLQICKIDVA